MDAYSNRVINTQGNHIAKQINLRSEVITDVFGTPRIYGIALEFTTILKSRFFDDKSLQRVVQAALSAADSEAELIDRGL